MHVIPTYPESIPLELEHREEIQPYLLSHRHGISEYSMASLYPFTKKRNYTVSTYNNEQGTKEYLFIGNQQNGEKQEKFAMIPGGFPGSKIMDQLTNEVNEINTISKESLSKWQSSLEIYFPTYRIEEDRNNADYVYDKKSLIDLVGQSLHKKLVHAQKFMKEHPERILLPSHVAPKKDMIKILHEWAQNKSSVEDHESTLLAIENQEALNLKGYVLYTKDIPIAFSLGEEDHSRFIIHIEKALFQYKGVYQYINRAFASELGDNIVEINREQDLGIDGLRQAKMTYEPSYLLMKYKIRIG
ncbi:MAG: DUF2156 domain-containing protein [Spirochaetia bacterium]|nr:DUF2156 domain-containing protein [Spirochaetia bacterium]